jgi:hypothetical protein
LSAKPDSPPPNSSSYWADDQGVTTNTRADAQEFLRVAGVLMVEPC